MNKELTNFEKRLVGRVKAAAERLSTVKSTEELSPILTVRRVKLELKPRCISGKEIKAIRKVFNVSQAIFALLVQVPKRTLENWEQGVSDVPGPAAVLFGDMLAHPEHWNKQFMLLMKRTDSKNRKSTRKTPTS